ncbi:MAG: NADP-dependent oxidoreductase [Candidatus Omnitrophica bacterium]|nr:NADP-dependent oxidoreductase [Candidatus Omnitrophota bacterium]
MKVILIEECGGPDKLKFIDLPIPEPGEAEVLIRVHAVGVNPVDWKIREGLLKDRVPYQFPIILGWDMSGVIVKRGHAARRFQEGDEVYGYCRRPVIQKGTYAEYIAIPESYVTQKPRNLSFEEAAAVPLTSLTAYQSVLDAGQLQKGQTLVVVGASGGVGSMAVQLGKIVGARVVALASPRNHDYLKSLGADVTLDYQGNFRDCVRAQCPDGADVVFACAGGDSLIQAYDCVEKGGRLLTIVEPGDPLLAQQKGVHLHYIFVEPNASQLEYIAELIEAQQLKVHVSEIYSFQDVFKAHENIETAHTQGKIVLKIA